MHSLDALGIELKLNQSSLKNDYLSFYEEKITARFNSSFRLLIVTNERPIETARMYATRFPFAEVVAISYGVSSHTEFSIDNITYIQLKSFDDLIKKSSTLGYFNVIVEHSSNKKSHKIAILKSFYMYLREKGYFFIEELHAKFIPQLVDCAGDDVLDMLSKACNLKIADNQCRKEADRFLIALSDSCDSILIRGKMGVIDKSKPTLKGIRTDLAIDLISKGSLSGAVLLSDANNYQFEHKNPSRVNLAKNAWRHPKSFTIQDSHITVFENVLCEPGQVVHKDGYLLHDSFRMQHHKKLANKNIQPLDNEFFLGSGADPVTHLDGQYLYLDSEYPCHFGHFTSEVISRLWAWDKLKNNHANLKVLIGLEKGKSLPGFVITILESFGISKSEMTTFDGCVSVGRLFTATPYYVIGDHINPDIKPVWRKIGKGVGRGASGIKGKRLFIARPAGGNRKCLNPDRLESIFKDYGFEFYNPENHTWADQVRTFSQAEVIAGYAGSGTFNTMFSDAVKKMFVIGSDSYTASNEHFICAIKEIELNYFWGDSLLSHENGWSHKAFMSDYNFNYARDEEALMKALSEL